MAMEPQPKIRSGPGLPPGHPRVQLTVRIDLLEERPGGCALNFRIPDDSALLAKYGTRGRALAACRDVLVSELDFLVREFADEA